MVVVGIILLVAFVGIAYFATYKPWIFVFDVPEYSKYEKTAVSGKELKGNRKFLRAWHDECKSGFAKRQINMRLDLPRPEGCVVINGTTLVVVGTKTVETDLYSAKVLTECVTVDKWDENRMKVIRALESQGIKTR